MSWLQSATRRNEHTDSAQNTLERKWFSTTRRIMMFKRWERPQDVPIALIKSLKTFLNLKYLLKRSILNLNNANKLTFINLIKPIIYFYSINRMFCLSYIANIINNKINIVSYFYANYHICENFYRICCLKVNSTLVWSIT